MRVPQDALKVYRHARPVNEKSPKITGKKWHEHAHVTAITGSPPSSMDLVYANLANRKLIGSRTDAHLGLQPGGETIRKNAPTTNIIPF